MFIQKAALRKVRGKSVRCPKCGSAYVERQRNQEVKCLKCGAVFYFVTPDTGSGTDFDRYNL